jgi:VIT1/CCC1 family predicted Fe2+/Mn2+ transporter
LTLKLSDGCCSVIGLSDGLTVPFALTAGLSSLGESKLVVMGGLAELIAGAISMGIGGFLASKAERDHHRFLKHHTAARIHRSCPGEIEREVYAVLGPVGVDVNTSRAVAKSLREVEMGNDSVGGSLGGGLSGGIEEGGQLRWKDEVGLTAFLLKFGEGLGTFSILLLGARVR